MLYTTQLYCINIETSNNSTYWISQRKHSSIQIPLEAHSAGGETIDSICARLVEIHISGGEVSKTQLKEREARDCEGSGKQS